MDKVIIDEQIQRIDKRLSDIESYIDLARDEITQLADIVQVSDEVYEFIENLIDNPNVSEEIQDKAGKLWQKI